MTIRPFLMETAYCFLQMSQTCFGTSRITADSGTSCSSKVVHACGLEGDIAILPKGHGMETLL